ncbi:hypothetical protein [Streptomyces cyaneofuscatus]|uniref:hypothetical protein n=1 Tax=Streptomyces cyaneofuscatus TaxID=66883 RepID=UPI003658E84C
MRGTACEVGSDQAEAVEIHDLGPGGEEVRHEPLPRAELGEGAATTPGTAPKSTTKSFIDDGWSVDCNDGGGTYTHHPVRKGFATGVGSSPATRTDNELRKNCDTQAP